MKPKHSVKNAEEALVENKIPRFRDKKIVATRNKKVVEQFVVFDTD
jgi:hypothetical protein